MPLSVLLITADDRLSSLLQLSIEPIQGHYIHFNVCVRADQSHQSLCSMLLQPIGNLHKYTSKNTFSNDYLLLLLLLLLVTALFMFNIVHHCLAAYN